MTHHHILNGYTSPITKSKAIQNYKGKIRVKLDWSYITMIKTTINPSQNDQL